MWNQERRELCAVLRVRRSEMMVRLEGVGGGEMGRGVYEQALRNGWGREQRGVWCWRRREAKGGGAALDKDRGR
jgi:hypothetical protein